MPFRRSRSLYDRDRNRPVTPSAEGYLGPEELRDLSRSPIVTASDDEDGGDAPESDITSFGLNSDQKATQKSILKVGKLYSNLIHIFIGYVYYQISLVFIHILTYRVDS